MKRLSPIIGFSAILSMALLCVACNTPKPTTETNRPSVSEADFNHKIECSRYIEAAEKKAQQYGKELGGDNSAVWPNMERVFYSPKANSCLFVWSNNMMQFGEGPKYTRRSDRGLNDALTGEELVREIYIDGDPVLGVGTELESDQRFFDTVHTYE